jgi:L-fucose mutarotase
MLKGIDSKLNADVLHCLRSMGHGDALVICDTNFPAESVARHTGLGTLLRMENLTCGEAISSILSVLPLDTFVEVVGAPDELPATQQEVQDQINLAEGKPRPMISVERFAFYDLARKCYAVIQTGERRFYGCFILRKGVVGPDE